MNGTEKLYAIFFVMLFGAVMVAIIFGDTSTC